MRGYKDDSASVLLGRALKTVRRMVERKVPFEHIEFEIERSDLDDEEKALLWLYAWCGGEARELRNLVTAGDDS